MALTNDQKQEIMRHLDEGKPLPEKYRFLLFREARKVELIWDGKTNAVCDVVLPFQTIEQVDEPRSNRHNASAGNMFSPESGRQLEGWNNKLIWGDNKLVLSSLLRGSLQQEIEKQGGLKLIYIDPPFDVGADFSMDIEIGDGTLTKEPSLLEEIAYHDTWGKGMDSYAAMIYERLRLMRNLLAEDGSIYVHCDWRVNGYIRLVMDEIFGKDMFINQIEWGYKTGGIPEDIGFSKKHDHLLFYKKGKKTTFNRIFQKSYVSTLPEPHTDSGKNLGVMRDDLCEVCRTGTPGQKYRMVVARDLWDDIPSIFRNDSQRLDYPTQKPEALLERIIKASSNEGDLVADFFCGSGTTAAVAEKLGRKWIATDLGKFAIHTTRKRMIGVQRELKKKNENYRAFEVLNLGKYERQHYIGVNPNLPEKEQEIQRRQKEREYVELILHAYKAQPADNDPVFQGKKIDRMIAIGPINLPVARAFVDAIVDECLRRKITQVDVLAFEFEMNLFPNAQEEAKKKGVDLKPKYIPSNVFDKRAVDKGQVVFHDVSYVEVRLHKYKKEGEDCVKVELSGYSTHYSQDANIADSLKKGKSRVVVEDGEVVRISKDKNGKVSRDLLTKSWKDWVDYWAVDFDHESKPEFLRISNPETDKTEERETGDFVFENEWQSFRTRQSRDLEYFSVEKKVSLPCKIAVKVVDIFGNDTMKVLEIK